MKSGFPADCNAMQSDVLIVTVRAGAGARARTAGLVDTALLLFRLRVLKLGRIRKEHERDVLKHGAGLGSMSGM
jgi:hypothetical protein